MAPQTWFITGCSSGFGAEFVRQLRALGDNVIATGRHAETKLAHLKDTGATIIDLGVTAPEDVIAAKVEEAWAVYVRVPLGTDGWTRIKNKCEETLKICEEWEDVAKSTDVQQ